MDRKRRSEVDSIDVEISRANSFGDRVEDLVLKRGGFPAGDRNNLLLAYWSLVFEFHRAILCLLLRKFYGAAFALVRPLLEATIRAHVAIMGSPVDVKNLQEDKYQTNFASVGKEIDNAFGTGELFEKLLTGSRKALHSYTHVGTAQLG